MEKTWKPTVAGILSIVAGALSAILWFFLILGILMFAISSRTSSFDIPVDAPANIVMLLVILISIPFLIICILAIVGGVYTLKRKIWGLALAGSIAAIIISWPLGIAATVFTAISKNEFE
ncbi:hypothetical protein ACFLYM_03200 [Chloroflexota bacterium]